MDLWLLIYYLQDLKETLLIPVHSIALIINSEFDQYL